MEENKDVIPVVQPRVDIKSIDELNEKVEIAIKKRQPHIFKIDVENMHIPMPSKKN